MATLSLREVFAQAAGLRRLVGDVPTQEFALIRLLLAILHDAAEGPEDIDDWTELWRSADSLDVVQPYLERYRGRFDLLHPENPFFQVAGLHVGSGDIASLNKIVADVPNGDPYFSMRMPGVDRLDFAEAARWVVHTQAFDISGIKSGVEGDPRTKGGKVYPLGVAWTGHLGGVMVEGHTLRETLLLNLVAADAESVSFKEEDCPAWRREQCGPGASDPLALASRPYGPRDLYTWQSRRLRLYHDDEGVYGVVLGYGDPLGPQNMQMLEPMTGWRRSQAQEKKHNLPLVYMPREHDPARAAWRGMAGLIPDMPGKGGAQSGDPAALLRPRVLEWMAQLTNEGILPQGYLVRTRIVGAKYGTQQSIIDELVDDSVAMPVAVLRSQDPRYGQAAVMAVGDADKAVKALADLAGDLARALGAEADKHRDAARDRGYGELDSPYRLWLRNLGESGDPDRERAEWQRRTYRIIRGLGRELLDHTTAAAWEGRVVDKQWFDDTSADRWFRIRLSNALPRAFEESESPGGPPGEPGSEPRSSDTESAEGDE